MQVHSRSISHIRDVKTLLERQYKEGSNFEFVNQVTSAIRSAEFHDEFFERSKPIKIRKTKYPPSKLVTLQHKIDSRISYVIVRSTTKKDLYHCLQNYQTGHQGYQWNNKFDRYRALYLVYESLVKKREYKFTATRHTICHSDLDNKKAKKVLHALFGDEKIDIKKRKHIKTLQTLHEELLAKTDKILSDLILKLARKSKERIGEFVIL